MILVVFGCVANPSSVQNEDFKTKSPEIKSVQTPSIVFSDSRKIKANNIAKQITVQVWSTSLIGSGTIVKRHDTVYTIITAAHVLKAGDPPYTIQTPDGQHHFAEIVPKSSLKRKDVVLLQFHSSKSTYEIASIGTVDSSSIDEKVYAAGFPLNNRSQLGSQLNNQLIFREGEIVMLLEKPLKDGYRLAYTSSVDLGMSGGPVLNERGEVIGINGLRDDPIWYIPMKYEDGTEPSSQIQELIAHSSLAIPLEDVLFVLD